MSYLFFDTETTGLPRRWNARVDEVDNWPRVVQLAWELYDDAGERLGVGDHIIKPEGFDIPQDVARIHGITTERAHKEGAALEEVLAEFSRALERAATVVAHNISFDEKVLGAEYLRRGEQNRLHGKQTICTKEASTDFCAIPGPYGYKWPKLSELYKTLFGVALVDLHNARADVEATARCFWELKRRGIV